jgi:hypothetical protein
MPSEWQPLFEQANDQITISFLTYSGLVQEAIYRHCDDFRDGFYRFTSKQQVVAHGRGGYIF